jgi:glc operon protein GlcG
MDGANISSIANVGTPSGVTFQPPRLTRLSRRRERHFALFPSRPEALMLQPTRFVRGGLMTPLKTLVGAYVVALLAASSASAQAPPPPYGPPIGIENARKVMAAAEAEASKNNWSVVVAILDSGGNIVMLHRGDDVQLSSIEIAEGKAMTALRFKRPSKVLDDAISGGGAGLRFLALKNIVPLEGGLPILIDGKIVGAIGVSGVLSSQDAQTARAAVDAVK